MAKHPKSFQTKEGRTLNTKRSLISIATMAALGLVASTGGAANVQYDGLGIKPQFQDSTTPKMVVMATQAYMETRPLPCSATPKSKMSTWLATARVPTSRVMPN